MSDEHLWARTWSSSCWHWWSREVCAPQRRSCHSTALSLGLGRVIAVGRLRWADWTDKIDFRVICSITGGLYKMEKIENMMSICGHVRGPHLVVGVGILLKFSRLGYADVVAHDTRDAELLVASLPV